MNSINQTYDKIQNLNINNIETTNEADILYKTLLDEIYSTIEQNPNIVLDNNIKITKPDVHFDVSKKTIWKNFRINCKQVNRSEANLQTYIQNEYSTTTSINGVGQLLIKGKYNLNNIGSSYKKYIQNYVQCNICKSIKTEINRNTTMRLDFIKCNNCNAEKVISNK